MSHDFSWSFYRENDDNTAIVFNNERKHVGN